MKFVRWSYSHSVLSILLTISGVAATSCKQEEAKHSASGNSGTSKTDDSTDKTETTTEDNDAFYTGFDGKTDYSLLLPGFRAYTAEDPSIAKIEAVKVTLSETVLDEMIAEQKKKNADFDGDKFKKMFARERTTYRVTPLKAGKTGLITSGGRGGEPGKTQSGWSKSATLDLVINSYSEAQWEAGKKRYTTDGGGNLKACKSCHETGAEGAPPHELGRIMEISDAQALTWITTGKLNNRVAKITHTWEFSTEDEQSGVVAFLRSKQTHDVETLTKLYFEEMLANGFPAGGPEGGPKEEETEETESNSETTTETE